MCPPFKASCPEQHEVTAVTVALPPVAAEHSLEERALLLQIAHLAIEKTLGGETVETAAPSERLGDLRGAFTSLRLDGELRGCMGYLEAIHPLYRTVAETAICAAFFDPRFLPVTAEEARALQIQISVLTSPRPILADEVVVGRHGLIVSAGRRRGLLLPQVAVEHGWEAEIFIEQTCLKAGLHPQAWRYGAALEGFCAEVFGEC